MQPLIGSDGQRHAAPTTVLGAPYKGRYAEDGSPVTLPAGTEVRQALADAKLGQFQARIGGVWAWVVAP